MTRKLFALSCCCFFILTFAMAQRGGSSSGAGASPTMAGDTIAGLSLDSLTRTHAFLSWGVTNRVRSYEVRYQHDTTITTYRLSQSGPAAGIPRSTGAKAEAWSIKAYNWDGTISPQALVVHTGVVVIFEEIFAAGNDFLDNHCNGESAVNPEFQVFFEDLCILADMDTLCRHRHLNPDLGQADWHLYLETQAELDNSGIQRIHDCHVEIQEAVRQGSSLSQNALAVRAYPNPFDHTLQLKVVLSTESEAIITLSDMTGRVVHTTSLLTEKQQTLRLSTRELPAGFYTVQLRQGAFVQTQKVLKQ